MELRGTVLNVVDFGAFVDVGLSDSGLIHISQLSAGYVRDPHEVVAVGDQVRAWVASIDQERRRVALTMIAPGTERPKPDKSRGRGRGRRQDGPQQPQPQAQPAEARTDASRKIGSRRHARRTGKPRHDRRGPPQRQPRIRLVTKNGLRNNWSRLRKKWRKAKPTSAPSATCCSSRRRKNTSATGRSQANNRSRPTIRTEQRLVESQGVESRSELLWPLTLDSHLSTSPNYELSRPSTTSHRARQAIAGGASQRGGGQSAQRRGVPPAALAVSADAHRSH